MGMSRKVEIRSCLMVKVRELLKSVSREKMYHLRENSNRNTFFSYVIPTGHDGNCVIPIKHKTE